MSIWRSELGSSVRCALPNANPPENGIIKSTGRNTADVSPLGRSFSCPVTRCFCFSLSLILCVCFVKSTLSKVSKTVNNINQRTGEQQGKVRESHFSGIKLSILNAILDFTCFFRGIWDVEEARRSGPGHALLFICAVTLVFLWPACLCNTVDSRWMYFYVTVYVAFIWKKKKLIIGLNSVVLWREEQPYPLWQSLSLCFPLALFIHAFFKLESLTRCTKKNMQTAAGVSCLSLKKLFRRTRVHLKMFDLWITAANLLQ